MRSGLGGNSHLHNSTSHSTFFSQSAMEEINTITRAIEHYAKAYQQLNELQRVNSNLIPEGDQKTGAVGEFYAKLYLQARYPDATIIFGGNSNKAWDIALTQDGITRYIQVKTTSAFSKYRKLSPIHHGWDDLYILHLNEGLWPNGFWVISENTIINPKEVFKECYGPRPDQHNKKSGKLLFGANRIEEFLHYINIMLPELHKPGGLN